MPDDSITAYGQLASRPGRGGVVCLRAREQPVLPFAYGRDIDDGAGVIFRIGKGYVRDPGLGH